MKLIECIIILVCIVFYLGCIEPLEEEDNKVNTIENIAHKYHQTHIYVEDDVFDCEHMTQDVWNILKSKGINSKIVFGNIDYCEDIDIEERNHVWLLAEVSPDVYLAIETTTGCVVYKETNPCYYRGLFFNNPKNYRDFINLYDDYNYQYADYENERQYYNRLVNIYNNANYYEQIQLESALIVTENNLEMKKKRYLETWIKIETILEYG